MVKSMIKKDYSPITLIKYQQTYNRILEFAEYNYNRTTFYLDDLFMFNFEMYLKTEIQNNQTTIHTLATAFQGNSLFDEKKDARCFSVCGL